MVGFSMTTPCIEGRCAGGTFRLGQPAFGGGTAAKGTRAGLCLSATVAEGQGAGRDKNTEHSQPGYWAGQSSSWPGPWRWSSTNQRLAATIRQHSCIVAAYSYFFR
jgi:hypothetical protein